MDRSAWARPIGSDEMRRRVGGRRRYNRERREQRDARRREIRHLLWRWRGTLYLGERGLQAAFARRYGVHPSVICKDFAALREDLPSDVYEWQPWKPYNPEYVRVALADIAAG